MDFSRLDTPYSSKLSLPAVCIPGEWRVDGASVEFLKGKSIQPATMAELLDEAVPAPKQKHNPGKLFEIPEVKIVTPDVQMELAAIRLRRYAHKDKFMKSADTEKIPTKFQIGTVIGGGLVAVGSGKESQAAGTINRKKKSGKSHLQSLMQDESVKDWLRKNIVKRTNVARPKSKHKKIKPARRN